MGAFPSQMNRGIHKTWVGFKFYHDFIHTTYRGYGEGKHVVGRKEASDSYHFSEKPHLHESSKTATTEAFRLANTSKKNFAMFRCMRVIEPITS